MSRQHGYGLRWRLHVKLWSLLNHLILVKIPMTVATRTTMTRAVMLKKRGHWRHYEWQSKKLLNLPKRLTRLYTKQ